MDKVIEAIKIARYSDVEIQRAKHYDQHFDNEDGSFGRWFNDVRAMLLVMPEISNFAYRLHTRSVDTGEVIVYRKKIKDDSGNICNVFQDKCLI